MKDIFQQYLSHRHTNTQRYWMEKRGLTERDEQRFTVDYDGDDDGGTVYIFDGARMGLDKLIFTFEFSSAETAEAFAHLMQEEVGNWDANDFYTAENVQQDAQRSYEAANSSFMGMGVLA